MLDRLGALGQFGKVALDQLGTFVCFNVDHFTSAEYAARAGHSRSKAHLHVMITVNVPVLVLPPCASTIFTRSSAKAISFSVIVDAAPSCVFAATTG